MTKLSGTQAVLLSAAAQRESGSVLPLPASLKAGGGTSKALAALLTRGYAEERPTSDPAQFYRTDGDQRLGVFITPAGLAAGYRRLALSGCYGLRLRWLLRGLPTNFAHRPGK